MFRRIQNTKQKRLNNGGFTIIETLIAITVMMIAIAGPLVISSKGLTAALYAKDQTTASFLAQESMEKIKNIRDNNISDGGVDWLNGLSICVISTPCDAYALSGGQAVYSIGSLSHTAYPLWMDIDSGYTPQYVNSTKSIPTIFSRYFYLKASGCDLETPGSCSEVVVTVIVNWNEGNTQNNVVLTSEITNATR